MHATLRLTVFAGLLGLSATSHAGYPNLITNGDFSSAQQVNGWTAVPPGATFSWSNDDRNADVNSGSIRVTSSVTGGRVAAACFAVNPGAPFEYTTGYRTVTGGAGAMLMCTAYGSAGCTNGSAIGTLGTPPGQGSSASWVTIPLVSGTLPANALSVQCQLWASFNGVGGDVEFDGVYFGSNTAMPVGLQGFDVE